MNQHYDITLHEHHIHTYTVSAASEQEARAQVLRDFSRNRLPFHRKGNLRSLRLECCPGSLSRSPEKRGLYVDTGTAPCPRTLSLDNLYAQLQGPLSCLTPFDDPVVLICRDPRLKSVAPPNRILRNRDGDLSGIICGPFFLCGLQDGALVSLPEDLMSKYALLFQFPDRFVNCGKGIIAVPLRPEPASPRQEKQSGNSASAGMPLS